MKNALLLLLWMVTITHSGSSQPGLSLKFIDHIHDKSRRLDELLKKETIQYLKRLAAKEQGLKRKLLHIDPGAATMFFGDALLQQISDRSLTIPVGGKYFPYVDSMQMALAFLQQNHERLSKKWNDKLKRSEQQLKILRYNLHHAEYIKQLIKHRKEQIKEIISAHTKLPRYIARQFIAFNKNLYYYSRQVNEFRERLNNRDRLTQKALHIISRSSAFKTFIQMHGELASLFVLPAPVAIVGLQNRKQVQQLIHKRFSSASVNIQQLLQQHIQPDADLPDYFKPNSQKTKSFRQRLQYATNVQSVKPGAFLPATTDIGFSLGYRLNDKMTIGIGSSYKVGWGRDISHIDITHQGFGLRTFIDIPLKGSLYVSGGYEQHYRPFMIWKSGLIGVSKILPAKSKLFKTTNIQLLWDFLSYRQTPRTQSFSFRIGYQY